MFDRRPALSVVIKTLIGCCCCCVAIRVVVHPPARLCSARLCCAVLCAPAAGCLRARGCSSADGSGQSTASGIKHRGRDYFKCQHNVMSCVRRSNVQTVLSGEQLIDQLRFVLLLAPAMSGNELFLDWFWILCTHVNDYWLDPRLRCETSCVWCAATSPWTLLTDFANLTIGVAERSMKPATMAARGGQCWWETAADAVMNLNQTDENNQFVD